VTRTIRQHGQILRLSLVPVLARTWGAPAGWLPRTSTGLQDSTRDRRQIQRLFIRTNTRRLVTCARYPLAKSGLPLDPFVLPCSWIHHSNVGAKALKLLLRWIGNCLFPLLDGLVPALTVKCIQSHYLHAAPIHRTETREIGSKYLAEPNFAAGMLQRRLPE